jgi:hypothetical protein
MSRLPPQTGYTRPNGVEESPPLAKDKHGEAADFDESGESTHAADEPTAVWDVETLRKAGLSDLVEKPESEPPGPATPADEAVKRPSIIVEEKPSDKAAEDKPSDKAAVIPQHAPRAAEPPKGLGWPSLVGLAVLLGASAYFLLRFLR